MKQLGVIYHLNTKLPPFSLFEKLGKGDVLSELKPQLEERGFHSKTADGIESSFAYVNNLESQFLEMFAELMQGDRFFQTFVWLKSHMSEIRLQIRNDYLSDTPVQECVSAIQNMCSDNPEASKLLSTFVKKAMQHKGDYSLFSLEKELDNAYFTLLEKSVSGMGNRTYRAYVHLLRNNSKRDAELRKSYHGDVAEVQDTMLVSSTYFRDIAEEECKFVNRARFEFDTALIVLQCFVTHQYLFYNMRLALSVPEKDRADMLVNYQIES